MHYTSLEHKDTREISLIHKLGFVEKVIQKKMFFISQVNQDFCANIFFILSDSVALYLCDLLVSPFLLCINPNHQLGFVCAKKLKKRKCSLQYLMGELGFMHKKDIFSHLDSLTLYLSDLKFFMMYVKMQITSCVWLYRKSKIK